jgi:hypothetical protein
MTDEKKEKKPVKPKKAEVVKPSKSKGADPKQPQPNTVVLVPTGNLFSSAGCPVTAYVGFNQNPIPGYTVNFITVSGTGPAPQSGVSDAKGEVKRIVPWNTVVRATVQSYKLLKSNDYSCGVQFAVRDKKSIRKSKG